MFSFSGNVSFRDILDGTWYIQELCKNISSYAKTKDILSILTYTHRDVANKYEVSKDLKHLLKQMPCFLTTLRKHFFLLHKDKRNQQIKYPNLSTADSKDGKDNRTNLQFLYKKNINYFNHAVTVVYLLYLLVCFFWHD